MVIFYLNLDIKDFLEKSAKNLESLFDTCCGFRGLQETVTEHKIDMIDQFSKLKIMSKELCSKMNSEEADGETSESGLFAECLSPSYNCCS